ncbi:FecR domain-containing protein [Sphingomonas sp. YL-JM2C]
MPDLSAKDRRDARKWLIKMMDRPDLHQAGLDAWIEGRPDRREFYLSLHAKMNRAAAGAELAGLEPTQPVVRADRSPASRSPAWGRVAATGLAFVVVLGIGFRTFSGHRMDLPGASAHVVLSTRVGEVRPERLDDGTIVTLDTGTAIDVKIARGQRTVVLRHGRARFAVASTGTNLPFTVQDGEKSVVANGGIFDVSDRGNLSALVVDGSAEVHLQPAVLFADGSRSVRLGAGQKLVLISGQEATPSAIAARPSDAQWIGGVKSFSEVPIGEIIAEANTYSATKIVLADPSMGDRLITAELHIRDVEAVAKAIAGYLKLSIDRSRPGKLLLKASAAPA